MAIEQRPAGIFTPNEVHKSIIKSALGTTPELTLARNISTAQISAAAQTRSIQPSGRALGIDSIRLCEG
jgi:hypothetical protein